MESHPRITRKDSKLSESKIILGSFPTWTLTPPDPLQKETLEEKEYYRNKNKDISFFYGSSGNMFWVWYKNLVDSKVSKADIKGIQNSLKKNKIGLTDVILQCNRKNRSSFDTDLTNRLYNHTFFNYPPKFQKLKILCTSKGVMNEMLLNKTFFSKHDRLKINVSKSTIHQSKIISTIGGDLDKIKKPFYQFIDCEKGGSIECLAIPSPGSPYRGLNAFGLNSADSEQYLKDYIKKAFLWFRS
jgi:hypothetical protein